MTPVEAKQYLDMFPNGTLQHQWFETDAFITQDRNGEYLFYDPELERKGENPIELWDWGFLTEIMQATRHGDPDIHTGWWYSPGREMDITHGGREWWEEIRSGKHSTNNTLKRLS